MEWNEFFAKLPKVGARLFFIGLVLLVILMLIGNSPVSETSFYEFTFVVSFVLMLIGAFTFSNK